MDTQNSEEFQNIIKNTTQPKGKRRLKWIISLLVFVVALLGFLYYKYQPVVEIKSTRDQAQIDAKALIRDVGKLIVLPTNEDPAIFEINDPAALIKQQPFFIGAEKGDKVLIYQQIARAIIYSPSRNIIVNVGPVTQEQVNAQSSASSTSPSVQSATSSVLQKSKRK